MLRLLDSLVDFRFFAARRARAAKVLIILWFLSVHYSFFTETSKIIIPTFTKKNCAELISSDHTTPIYLTASTLVRKHGLARERATGPRQPQLHRGITVEHQERRVHLRRSAPLVHIVLLDDWRGGAQCANGSYGKKTTTSSSSVADLTAIQPPRVLTHVKHPATKWGVLRRVRTLLR